MKMFWATQEVLWLQDNHPLCMTGALHKANNLQDILLK